MISNHALAAAVLLSAILPFSPAAHAQTQPPPAAKILLDTKAEGLTRLQPTSSQVTLTQSRPPDTAGTQVTIQPGPESYPGVTLRPQGKAFWDLSPFGHVEARVMNSGDKPLSVALRVDNGGGWKQNPWNTESVFLAPGETGIVSTTFGYSYGHKPGYALKPSAVVRLMLFVGKSDAAQSFRIESLTAGGPAGEAPPVAPEEIRVKPQDGHLFGSGIPAENTVQTNAASGPGLSLKPAQGRWDLRDYLAVRIRVQNNGQTPLTPQVRLESNGGTSDWTAGARLAPGGTEEVRVRFAAPADLSRKNTGSRITSDTVSAVTLSPREMSAANTKALRFLAAEAILETAPPLPGWLGKRPPVAGDWVKTLDDEFSGPTLDQSHWSVYGDNYWDKQTHWSKADVLVGGGLVRLRYEKKTGFNNDDPAQKPSDYAAGYLHTYGKWAQRYGYFEARMKLPTAPGLWPAFWMMPDRGLAAGPEQWKRQDTANGGMEFDIMEHLTRWGPNRYNIAMHYDGYGQDHKQLGSDKVYVQPDRDGFVTCGLLWTPGSAIYYCNGQEVLRWENSRIANVPEILMFTLPMGGWDNSPLDDARLPDEFAVDYVRVWQRKDLAAVP